MAQIILFQGVCFWEADYLINNIFPKITENATYGYFYDFDTFDSVILFGTIVYVSNIAQQVYFCVYMCIEAFSYRNGLLLGKLKHEDVKGLRDTMET